MINAIIQTQSGTLLVDLPRSSYDLMEKMYSIGARCLPQDVKLRDEEDDPIQVKLYSENDLGKHLLLVLNEKNTLSDANTVAFMVQNASADIQPALHQKILTDQYPNMDAITSDIRQMTYDAGPVKRVFYCPLEGNLEEPGEDPYPVSDHLLKEYAYEIDEAVRADMERNDQDMASFFHGDPALKDKLVSMQWSTEVYRGRLFGKIECSLKENLSAKETEELKRYISGQNSDGWGEGFEQRPLKIEEGDLFVSFWNSGDDYAIMNRQELVEYMEEQNMRMGGM